MSVNVAANAFANPLPTVAKRSKRSFRARPRDNPATLYGTDDVYLQWYTDFLPTSQGNILYTGAADHNGMITFLNAAWFYAMRQSGTEGSTENNPNYRFTSGDYTLSVILLDSTLFSSGVSMSWNTFGWIVFEMYDLLLIQNQITNTTFVGQLDNSDDFETTKLYFALTESYYDATIPANETLPSGTSGDPPPGDSREVSFGTMISGASNGKRKRQLDGDAELWAIGATAYFSRFWLETPTTAGTLIASLTRTAATMIMADSADDTSIIEQFQALLPNRAARQAFPDVRLQLQTYATHTLQRIVVRQLMQLLARGFDSYFPMTGQESVVYGEIEDASGTTVASYSIGALLSSVGPTTSDGQPLNFLQPQFVDLPIAVNPDGSSYLAIKDEL